MKFNVFWHHSLHSCHLDCIRLTYPAPLRFGRGRAAVASEVTGTGARGPGLILLQILEEELITAPLLKSLCALCQLAVIDLKATSLISIHIWIYAYMCLHIYCVSERKHPIARQRSSTKKCVAIWPLVYFFFLFFFISTASRDDLRGTDAPSRRTHGASWTSIWRNTTNSARDA